VIYAVVDWMTKSADMALFALRLLLALFIFFQSMRFWRQVQTRRAETEATSGKIHWRILILTKSLSYAVVGAGLVLDISGYNALALYWYKSWGISITLFLWAGLFFMLLMEWRSQLKTRSPDTLADGSGNVQPIRWLVLQLLWLVWFFSMVISIILSWGGKQAVIVSFIRSLNYPITIGKISFSITSFIFAFLVLVITHSLVRLWRFILKEKILSGSGLETGLQDSITMITVYVFWAFGILLSLHAFGLGTTSLALAFGALGIGLGFGLQNIFNNFISGIIMLFERPIQVGDDVEINGVWATVKKINVRATVVQTYDNASLIIPNSEFISAQVTNWSFKDKRLRRNIDVGVAYGSNIELVRDTLLEIAKDTQNVFKTPKPDVVFRDFGDSALIFRLRVWTDIDNIFKVETAIRFEIDRLFKERGLVIAFPQRDVHVFYENEESNSV
jgi:small-conductance mechanosensitive channel